MMEKIKLSNRLFAVAALIEPSDGVIDVGTDHGYLPVYLVQTGPARRIMASDINAGPLRHAMTTAEQYGVNGQIEFIRTDGLEGIDHTGVKTVIIAGMGGETMMAILEPALWVRQVGVQLVLQPQTKVTELTVWLGQHGFIIKDVYLAEDDGRIYEVMSVGWTGNGLFRAPLEILREKKDALLQKYVDRELQKVRNIMTGLEKAAAGKEALPELGIQLTMLEQLKEEMSQWQQ